MEEFGVSIVYRPVSLRLRKVVDFFVKMICVSESSRYILKNQTELEEWLYQRSFTSFWNDMSETKDYILISLTFRLFCNYMTLFLGKFAMVLLVNFTLLLSVAKGTAGCASSICSPCNKRHTISLRLQ